MRLRKVRWQFVYALLIALGLASVSLAASCPLLTHDDANEQREFQNVCQLIAAQSLAGSSSALTQQGYGGYARGVKISYITAVSNHVLWDDVVLMNVSSATIRNFVPGSLRLADLTTTGANGLDVGSIAANTFYYVYIISDGTNFNALYSTRTASPVMPSGYTYKLLVGTVLTDGSSHLNVSLQIGNHVEYQELKQIVHDTSHNNAFQITSAASYVPPNIAWRVDYEILIGGSYSSAGMHEMAIEAGPNLGGSGTVKLQQDIVFHSDAGSSPQVAWTGTLSAVNEATPEITWISVFDATGLAAFNTFVYVTGYTLTALPVS